MLARTMILCLIALISFSLIPLSFVLDRDNQTAHLRVHNGVMDLSGWDDSETKRIKLDGEWEFYWNRLLTPEQFREQAADNPVPDAYIAVPSQWNGKNIGGAALPAYGSATYRMTLKNVPFSGVFAIKKMNIRFSSAVYANGQKLFADGEPSLRADGYRSGNVPRIGFFSADQGDIEIIVHVSNYDYINAGIPLSIYFGEQAAMTEHQQMSTGFAFAIFAILSTLAGTYFICFVMAAVYAKRDYTLLVFAVICSLFAAYNGLIEERPLSLLFPQVPFEILYKAKDMISVASFIVLAVFFYQFNKSLMSLKITRIITFVLGFSLLLIVVLPIREYVALQPLVIGLYELLIVWLLLRIAFHYIKNGASDRVKMFLLYMAILCINLYSLDLILFAYTTKENQWPGQIYIVLFNVILIFLIALRFFEAYRTIDDMKNHLIRQDKIKDDFLSNTSHELKTPLNAIVSITDTILKGVEGPVTEKQAQNLAIVLGSGKRLTHLVNELLDYSKMKHGDIALYKSSIDLKAAVDSVIRMHAFLLGGKKIELVNAVPDNMAPVYADGSRLLQILHNLLGNSLKFTDRGIVEVSAEAIRGMVHVRVKDSGIGISPDMQERIFQAFEQGDASETKQYGGTGLGLSITKKLVELQGGRIEVDSVPGHGSVFTFTLPVSAGEPESFNEQAAGEHEVSYRNRNVTQEYPIRIKGGKDEPILVVDDDYANLQSMINLLRLEGYSAVAVNSGRMALEELSRKTDFFLVILDITMPDMSGIDVLIKLRERFSPFELPALMLTARSSSTDMLLAMEHGANDFVGKPFEAEELMARVRSLTRLKASVKNAKDAEIAFLRSQIKPHFLFNALNSIAALCVDEPLIAEKLTLELSKYLRSSFDFKQLDSLTTLSSELELVKAYISIEKARFGERLQVEYDIDADIDMGIRIPPLIVQPLVENAVRHGLMSKVEGGKVTVAIQKLSNDEVRFTIEDNGCGMSETMLAEVLRPDPEKKGVGLWNIGRRMKLIYGEGLQIKSKEGAGTKVIFRIGSPAAEVSGGEV
ncbi:ATP-binding protein [Paenibacillus thermotolerans]|uniref:ATP-binding protein n=1 Tax=Paenibacillus thermotolerans TaxID=3027807 RepID=UPI0023682CAC|nr:MULTISPECIES: ATP-binding protein [unclassified Paenibacillus]